MTCFWNGILSLLDLNELNSVLNRTWRQNPHPKKFIKALKKYNVPVSTIKHNGNILRESEVRDNFKTIKSLDPNQCGEGYLCSGCEPVFFLICYLFNYDIEHMIRDGLNNDVFIQYTHPSSKGKLKFGSSTRHFYSIEKNMY